MQCHCIYKQPFFVNKQPFFVNRDYEKICPLSTNIDPSIFKGLTSDFYMYPDFQTGKKDMIEELKILRNNVQEIMYIEKQNEENLKNNMEVCDSRIF